MLFQLESMIIDPFDPIPFLILGLNGLGCRWISPNTHASSTSKTGRHDIAEILLKVALDTNNQISNN
jgi:hypothetical protein